MVDAGLVEMVETKRLKNTMRSCEVCGKQMTRVMTINIDGKPFENYFLCDAAACEAKLREDTL